MKKSLEKIASYKKEIEKAEEEIRVAERNLINAREKFARVYADSTLQEYFTKIKSIFIFSKNEMVRERIRRNLDGIIMRYEPSKVAFNYKKAKKIREKSGLSLEVLGKQIGVDTNTITGYEAGNLGGVRRGKLSQERKAYLTWLKGEGYNPYDLK